MEQKEALHKFTNSGQTTVIQILKAFSVLTGESLRHYLADRAAQYRQRTGELGYYQFMAEKSGKSIITLPSSFNQPVNLERLREVLAEHGVAFAFRQYDGKTDLLFRFQDKEVINKAMDDLLKDIHDPDAKLKRFIKGSTLAQQLSRYNGQQPIRKEPVIASLAAKLKALDFYAQHGDGTLRSGQAQQIEQNLMEAMATAKERLADLDDKMVQLRQEMAQQLDDPKVRANLQKELNAWTISRDLLHEQYEQAVHDLDYHRGVHAKMTNVYEQQEKKAAPTEGPKL